MIWDTKNKSSQTDIEIHLEKCSEQFTPSLSSYVNILEYSTKLFEKSNTIEIWFEHDLIGLLAYYKNPNRSCFISNLSVVPLFHEKGLGYKMLKILKLLAINDRINYLTLDVNKLNNRAVNFYKNYGFVEVSQNKELINMQYQLND